MNKSKQNIKTKQKKVKQKTPFEIVIEAIHGLPNERMQDILVRRFGLDNKKPQTLEGIGKMFGITRERVRQIENEALKRIEKERKINRIIEVLKRLEGLLNSRRGVMSERRIMSEYSSGKKRKINKADDRALFLVLRMGKDFFYLNKPQDYEKTWYLKGVDIKLVDELNKWLEKKLKEEDRVVSKKRLLDIINENDKFKPIDDEILYTYVDIPKKVQKNIFNRWGLISWPLVKPRGVRDKIYLAFKKRKKPMHFSEVAKEVNSLGVDKKKICTPTVHNELIKDKRFVLIGRGIYALAEWNYKPGTVAEVLEDILKRHDGPMEKEALIEELLKQRKVKPSTVLLNLHNSKGFGRKGKNLYYLKKKKRGKKK